MYMYISTICISNVWFIWKTSQTHWVKWRKIIDALLFTKNLHNIYGESLRFKTSSLRHLKACHALLLLRINSNHLTDSSTITHVRVNNALLKGKFLIENSFPQSQHRLNFLISGSRCKVIIWGEDSLYEIMKSNHCKNLYLKTASCKEQKGLWFAWLQYVVLELRISHCGNLIHTNCLINSPQIRQTAKETMKGKKARVWVRCKEAAWSMQQTTINVR